MNVLFDEKTHTYTDDLGMIVPGVTSVIRPLYDFSMLKPGVLEKKAKLGTAAHKACEIYDQRCLNVNSVHEKVLPYLSAWIKFRRETKCVIIRNELKIDSDAFRYAGTLDRVGTINDDNAICLIDIKTTSVISHVVAVQLSAYMRAYNDQQNDLKNKITKCFACQLKEDGSYKLHRFENIETHFGMFLACLKVHNWRLMYE